MNCIQLMRDVTPNQCRLSNFIQTYLKTSHHSVWTLVECAHDPKTHITHLNYRTNNMNLTQDPLHNNEVLLQFNICPNRLDARFVDWQHIINNVSMPWSTLESITQFLCFMHNGKLDSSHDTTKILDFWTLPTKQDILDYGTTHYHPNLALPISSQKPTQKHHFFNLFQKPRHMS